MGAGYAARDRLRDIQRLQRFLGGLLALIADDFIGGWLKVLMQMLLQTNLYLIQ